VSLALNIPRISVTRFLTNALRSAPARCLSSSRDALLLAPSPPPPAVAFRGALRYTHHTALFICSFALPLLLHRVTNAPSGVFHFCLSPSGVTYSTARTHPRCCASPNLHSPATRYRDERTGGGRFSPGMGWQQARTWPTLILLAWFSCTRFAFFYRAGVMLFLPLPRYVAAP